LLPSQEPKVFSQAKKSQDHHHFSAELRLLLFCLANTIIIVAKPRTKTIIIILPSPEYLAEPSTVPHTKQKQSEQAHFLVVN